MKKEEQKNIVAFMIDDEVEINGYNGYVDFIGADTIAIKSSVMDKRINFNLSEIETLRVINAFDVDKTFGLDEKWGWCCKPTIIEITENGARYM
jgi:hypothetical protein